MNRLVSALLICLMVLSAAAVYDMKYEAETSAETVARLEREITQEREQISLLKAEWSMLTQPARLQQLVDHHQDILQLEPLTARHIGTVDEVPEKPVEPAADAVGEEGVVPSFESEAPAATQRAAEAPETREIPDGDDAVGAIR